MKARIGHIALTVALMAASFLAGVYRGEKRATSVTGQDSGVVTMNEPGLIVPNMATTSNTTWYSYTGSMRESFSLDLDRKPFVSCEEWDYSTSTPSGCSASDWKDRIRANGHIYELTRLEFRDGLLPIIAHKTPIKEKK